MPNRQAQTLIARLVPRDDIVADIDLSTPGKVDVYHVASQSAPGLSYRATYTHHNRTYYCGCPGFAGHGHCRHADSLAYYAKVDQARRCYREWTDDRLAYEQDSLLAVHADLGLDWPGLAELDAIGEEVAARMSHTAAA